MRSSLTSRLPNSNCTKVFLSAIIIHYTMATRVCLSKFILKAYNVEGLKSWGMFLVLILVSLGCIMYQQTGNKITLIAYFNSLVAYYANFMSEYKKNLKKKVKQELP